jgi:flagellum-specific ATP synthase
MEKKLYSALPKLEKMMDSLDDINTVHIHGRVNRVVGTIIEGNGPGSSVGSLCDIYPNDNIDPIRAEVVGFKKNSVFLMPIGPINGIAPGSKIVAVKSKPMIKVGNGLLGRVIDGMGNPIDGKGPIKLDEELPIYADPINPLERSRIKEPLDVGIKAINGLMTCGKGQRLGVFAGSGVGKSVLLGMISRHTTADVNVIALIGERGREVREFLEKDLGEEGLKKSVVIAATSDQPPLIRIRGAFIATAIAEYFRNQGKDTMLMMDSITRFAMAQREVGLATGEPPTTKGYTPSVFALLPRLLERAGSISDKGSITGFYAVLVEGDDMNDPVADSVRSILDGHIILSRDLTTQNHYPAIDVLESLSRVMIDVVPKEHVALSRKLVKILDAYKQSEDLIKIGAYVKGTNRDTDYAISMIDRINDFLKQDIDKQFSMDDTINMLAKLLK